MTTKRQHTLFGECLAEFIGTGLLIFFGVGCVAALVLTGAEFGQWEVSIVWGFGVAIAIYCTAGVSGAHINPAVTIALAAFHGFDKQKVLPYIVAQMAGAFCSAALVYGLYSNLFIDYEIAHDFVRGSEEALATAGIFSTYPHASLSFFDAIAVEFVITAVLMFGILALSDENNGAPRGPMNPLLIGVLIAVIGGSLGMLPSASISALPPKNGRRRRGGKPALYEPIHGSAPDIAGKSLANPMASILSAAMLLRFSAGLNTEADAIEKAVDSVLAEGYRTLDISAGNDRPLTTTQVGDMIAGLVSG